jgi:hypothetical protein
MSETPMPSLLVGKSAIVTGAGSGIAEAHGGLDIRHGNAAVTGAEVVSQDTSVADMSVEVHARLRAVS